jgi:hypothetical protein
MLHHIIDFNYMYHYAMFRGVDGVERGFILKPKQSVYASKRGSQSVSSVISMGFHNHETQHVWDPIKFLTIKLISGRYLFPQVKQSPKVFVQVTRSLIS